MLPKAAGKNGFPSHCTFASIIIFFLSYTTLPSY